MNIFNKDNNLCLCGSGQSYQHCCGLYLSYQQQLPPTAEALMRSRYTAYARRDTNYLLNSWDAGKRPADIDFSKETAQWQKLVIVNTKKGAKQDSKGIVEFKAFYLQDGCDYFMHEISRFVKIDHRWFYQDGVIKAAGKVAMQNDKGRNALFMRQRQEV